MMIFLLGSYIQGEYPHPSSDLLVVSLRSIINPSQRKLPKFRDVTTGFPAKMTSEKRAPYWGCVTTQIWVVLLIG